MRFNMVVFGFSDYAMFGLENQYNLNENQIFINTGSFVYGGKLPS